MAWIVAGPDVIRFPAIYWLSRKALTLTYIKQSGSSNCDKGTHIMPKAGRRNGARRISGAIMGRGS